MDTKFIRRTAAVIITALLFLCGCGSSGYDFSEPELSGAIGMKGSMLSSSSVGFEKKTIEKSYPKIDRYSHRFERNGGTEFVALTCNSEGVIIDVNIESEGDLISEFCIYGVHTGDSREKAESLMDLKFGEGSADVFNAASYISLAYNDKKYGMVTISVDAATNKVSGIDLIKPQ